MNTDTILLYTIFSFFYVISPGPAIFLAIANGMSGDFKSVLASSIGNILGLFILSSISIIGLGSIILASASLFFMVKLIGAAYLIYLGIKQFKLSKPLNTAAANKHRHYRSYFTEGFLLAVTNPKPILFFVAIFPQFINIESSLGIQFSIMTSIFMLLSLLSLTSYGFMAKSTKRFFSKANNMKWFHRITGGFFITIGVGLMQLKSAQS